MANPYYHGASFGSTEWGCVFAIRLARLFNRQSVRRRVALISDDQHVGGFTGGGLANWDIGRPSKRLRGIYKELYQKCGFAGGLRYNRNVDPALAERTFIRMLAAEGVDVIRGFQLAGIAKTGGDNTAVTTLIAIDGRAIDVGVVYDGSICMDLIQKVSPKGVGWMVGRESKASFDEPRAGWGNNQRVTRAISPYQSNGSLRPGVSPMPSYAVGDAYPGVDAYALRTVYTTNVADMVPFHAGKVDKVMVSTSGSWYNRDDYLLHAARYSPASSFIGAGAGPSLSGSSDNVILTDPVTHQPIHWQYPEGSYAFRADYMNRLKRFTIGWNFFCYQDPAWAGRWQTEMQTRGYPKSQFKDNDNIAWAIYLRRTAIPINDYKMSSHDLTVTDPTAPRNVFKATSVAIGGYTIDTKTTINVVSADGSQVIREGGTKAADKVYRQGYSIPLASMFNSAICPNLLTVPSCTAIAWGSIRIVVNLCVAADAAAFAAYEYVTNGTAFTAIDVEALRAKLVAVRLYVDPLARGADLDDPEDEGDGVVAG